VHEARVDERIVALANAYVCPVRLLDIVKGRSGSEERFAVRPVHGVLRLAFGEFGWVGEGEYDRSGGMFSHLAYYLLGKCPSVGRRPNHYTGLIPLHDRSQILLVPILPVLSRKLPQPFSQVVLVGRKQSVLVDKDEASVGVFGGKRLVGVDECGGESCADLASDAESGRASAVDEEGRLVQLRKGGKGKETSRSVPSSRGETKQSWYVQKILRLEGQTEERRE
jgi:hypothetical protein